MQTNLVNSIKILLCLKLYVVVVKDKLQRDEHHYKNNTFLWNESKITTFAGNENTNKYKQENLIKGQGIDTG